MNTNWLRRNTKLIVGLVLIVAIGIGLASTWQKWIPQVRNFIAYIKNEKTAEPAEDTQAAPDETPDTLKLTPAAWKNIGLETGTVMPTDFVNVISVPAIVVERPGRSQIEITAPMTGVVTQVYPLERQIVEPGTPLFDLRLTHEDVVSAQSEFLTSLQLLDVATQELNRLQNITEGIIQGKRIVEQKYEKEKAATAIQALRQSLLLHGLSEEQVANIEKTRNVLTKVTVVAPPFSANHEHLDLEHKYHIQSIRANRGESVPAGQLLGVLADHCLLNVEGLAFEDDVQRLLDVAQEQVSVEVVPVTGNGDSHESLSLQIQSVADAVDVQSRALKFYLLLPNTRSQIATDSSGHVEKSFASWDYRPGQRMEVRIPTTAVMKNKIVLPPEAVVIDSPNAFVFEQNGDNFDRIDVHVLHQGKDAIVLENDGQLAGSTIAMNGAYLMHLALKNQAGGAIDPHAGHTH